MKFNGSRAGLPSALDQEFPLEQGESRSTPSGISSIETRTIRRPPMPQRHPVHVASCCLKKPRCAFRQSAGLIAKRRRRLSVTFAHGRQNRARLNGAWVLKQGV